MSTMNLYEELFDLVVDNCDREGGHLSTTHSSFRYLCECVKETVDVKELISLDTSIKNREFMQCAYFSILERVVDDSTYNYWEKWMGLTQNEFRIKLLRKLLYSPEARIKGKAIVNNRLDIMSGYFLNIGSYIFIFFYFKVFLKLPKGFQNFIKKLPENKYI